MRQFSAEDFHSRPEECIVFDNEPIYFSCLFSLCVYAWEERTSFVWPSTFFLRHIDERYKERKDSIFKGGHYILDFPELAYVSSNYLCTTGYGERVECKTNNI